MYASGMVEARIEAYCLDKAVADGSGKFAACVLAQSEANKKVSLALDSGQHSLVSRCTGFTTGNRGLGSMEVVDSEPVARCIEATDAPSLFGVCVLNVTGKPWDGERIFWSSRASLQIADCFNAKIGK